MADPLNRRNRAAAYALAAGFLGWTLDAFDFFLVVICAPQIAEHFHVTDVDVKYSVTLTLFFRPVGALIFGLLADRFGRRWPMIIDLLFYSAIEVATAFAPTFHTFLILRALFGIGMGGEWGVGASLVMEQVSPRWRGVLSGLLQEGYAFGYLLSALAARTLLVRFGWQSLFLLGGVPALLALFVRFGVHESEVWEKNKSDSWSHLGKAIAANWKLWIGLTILMAMMNFSSHGTQDNYPVLLKHDRGVSVDDYTDVVMISMGGAILGGLAFGLASDRFGRRLMMAIAFVGALAVLPLWTGKGSLSKLAAGAFAMQFMIQGAWGIIPAHINELTPDKIRGLLPGFAYQCGNLIAAPIAMIQATMAKSSSYGQSMTATCAVIFSVAIVVILLGKEKRGVTFGKG